MRLFTVRVNVEGSNMPQLDLVEGREALLSRHAKVRFYK